MGIFDLASDLVKIAIAPVEVAADLTRVVTKPVADIATTVQEEVEEMVSDVVDDR
jgi:hypothetical protein